MPLILRRFKSRGGTRLLPRHFYRMKRGAIKNNPAKVKIQHIQSANMAAISALHRDPIVTNPVSLKGHFQVKPFTLLASPTGFEPVLSP
jgi:hypothetical protein